MVSRGAGRATFGIGFAQNYRETAEFREGFDDVQTGLDVSQFFFQSHADVAIDERWAAFGVVADEIDWNACLGATIEKEFQERGRFGIGGAGGGGASDLRCWEISADAFHCAGVELEIFFGRSLPIADVGFVPDLPEPFLDVLFSVSLDAVLHDLKIQLFPLAIVFGRIAPTGSDSRLRPVVTVRLRIYREGFGHEADFEHGASVGVAVSVEDAIEDFPIIDGMALRVFGVDVRGSPFEGRFAVSGGQKIMSADVDGDGRERRQFVKKHGAVRAVGVIGLVVAEPIVDGFEGCAGGVGTDVDGYRGLGGEEKERRQQQ
jgi:hypothetical protein